jgi:putative endonuclease
LLRSLDVIPAKAGIHLSVNAEHAMTRRPSYVYVLASQPHGTLYVGVTTDLIARIAQHREGTAEGFTKKYKVNRLVYFETHESVEAAILREKQIKKWNRTWKIRLIEERNLHWDDLYGQIAVV